MLTDRPLSLEGKSEEATTMLTQGECASGKTVYSRESGQPVVKRYYEIDA